MLNTKKTERQETMDQLLNQMATSFKRAFPTPEELTQWLALINLIIFEDKNAKDANASMYFTFDLGFNLLPKLMKAETDDDQIQEIEEMFKDFYSDFSIYNKVIPFIIYKNLSSELQTCDDLPYEAIHIIGELQNIAAMGNRYAGFVFEEKAEKASLTAA